MTLSASVRSSLARLINFRTVVGFGTLIYALIIIVPFYYLALSSFKSSFEIFSSPLGLPSNFSLAKYVLAVQSANLTQAISSSATITAGSVVLTLVLAVPASYAVARIESRLTTWIESFFSLGFLISAYPVLVPILLIMIRLGLYGSPLALILFYPAIRLAATVVILSSYMRGIPKELEEAAWVDGATRWRAIVRIFLPLARPGLIIVVLLNFIELWNEYFFALVLLSYDNRTVQVAVPTLVSEHVTDYGRARRVVRRILHGLTVIW